MPIKPKSISPRILKEQNELLERRKREERKRLEIIKKDKPKIIPLINKKDNPKIIPIINKKDNPKIIPIINKKKNPVGQRKIELSKIEKAFEEMMAKLTPAQRKERFRQMMIELTPAQRDVLLMILKKKRKETNLINNKKIKPKS
jgi:hypothetical protein